MHTPDENDAPAPDDSAKIEAETLGAATLGFEWGPYERPLPSEIYPEHPETTEE